MAVVACAYGVHRLRQPVVPDQPARGGGDALARDRRHGAAGGLQRRWPSASPLISHIADLALRRPGLRGDPADVPAPAGAVGRLHRAAAVDRPAVGVARRHQPGARRAHRLARGSSPRRSPSASPPALVVSAHERIRTHAEPAARRPRRHRGAGADGEQTTSEPERVRSPSPRTGASVACCVAAAARRWSPPATALPGKPTEAERPLRPAQVVDFATLYGQNCAGCHGADGLLGGARPLNDPVYLAVAGRERLRPGDRARACPHTPMPGFAPSARRHADRRSRSTSSPTASSSRWGGARAAPASRCRPTRRRRRGDAQRGAQAFATRCAGCHGADGSGGPQGGSVVDGAYLGLVSDQALRIAVICGRTDLGMPDWRGRRQRHADERRRRSPTSSPGWSSKRPQFPGQPYRGGTDDAERRATPRRDASRSGGARWLRVSAPRGERSSDEDLAAAIFSSRSAWRSTPLRRRCWRCRSSATSAGALRSRGAIRRGSSSAR